MTQIEQRIAAQAASKCTGGRHNIKHAAQPNPLIRWPNENLPVGEGARRPAYDELAEPQFVSGMILTILDIQLPMFRHAVLYELKAIMDMASSSGWPVAKAIFA